MKEANEQDHLTPSAVSSVHTPILVAPIVDRLTRDLESRPPGWLVDATFGGGGHARALLARLQAMGGTSHRLLGLDRDPGAIARARVHFAPEIAQGRLHLVHARFGSLGELAPTAMGQEVNRLIDAPIWGLVADLGFSSDQLVESDRGLSFREDGYLDMRLDPSQGVPLAQWLPQQTPQRLEEVLRQYGEERFARRIAQRLAQSIAQGRSPRRVSELVHLVVQAIPAQRRHGRLHAATRTFQALRMVINDECGELETLMRGGLPRIAVGGALAVLSFHSLEDRKVKWALQATDWLADPRKPIVPTAAEVQANARARSAKLRLAQKIA